MARNLPKWAAANAEKGCQSKGTAMGSICTRLGTDQVLKFAAICCFFFSLVSPTSAELTCPSGSHVERIRANPTEVNTTFRECLVAIRAATAQLEIQDEADLFAVFVSIVAHRMAPYGNSLTYDLDELLREPALDCDNYMVLAARLHVLGDLPNKGRLMLAGFDSGPIGNHGQLLYVGNRSLLLDPTFAIVAQTDFDGLMMGKPAQHISFYHWHENRELVDARKRVEVAIDQGAYRPSNLLYYFPNLDSFLRWSSVAIPKILLGEDPTPYLPTPGLRRRLP